MRKVILVKNLHIVSRRLGMAREVLMFIHNRVGDERKGETPESLKKVIIDFFEREEQLSKEIEYNEIRRKRRRWYGNYINGNIYHKYAYGDRNLYKYKKRKQSFK